MEIKQWDIWLNWVNLDREQRVKLEKDDYNLPN